MNNSKKTKRILITAFEAFGDDEINPTIKIVDYLVSNANDNVVTEVLPVVFDDCLLKLEQAIEKHKADVVIALGLAGGRPLISLERVAINVNDARIPDNKGNQPIDTCVVDDAPDAYFSKLPIKRMLQSLFTNEVPAHISNSAGTYVCNHLMFGLLHLIQTRYPKLQGGFIHVPYLDEQVGDRDIPSLPLSVMTKAIELCIETCLNSQDDIKLNAGTIH